MLKLISRITFIKNKNTISDGVNKIQLSNNFNVPAKPADEVIITTNTTNTTIRIVGGRTTNGQIIPSTTTNSSTTTTKTEHVLNKQNFIDAYESGKDVALIFNWVNNIEINSSFKQLTKTATIRFPRNLAFDGLNLMKGSNPVFGRGDRVIIETGYDGNLKEVFRGYIVKVGFNTPLILECEDQAFALKQIKVKYPDSQDKAGKISFKNLLFRILQAGTNHNTLLTDVQDVYDFNSAPNTETKKNIYGNVPIICPTDTEPFTYSTSTEKSVAEVLVDLKKKLGIYSYFDDFGNLHFELPFINSQQLSNLSSAGKLKTFHFEKQIISDSSMKFQIENEINIKIIFESKRSNKKEGAFYGRFGKSTNNYIGDALGDTITIHAPEDMSQSDCDKFALLKLKAEKYTGFSNGSCLETFGEPIVYLGQAIHLLSEKFPEKDGNYAIVGVKRSFGMNGYRQNIEIGISLNNGQ